MKTTNSSYFGQVVLLLAISVIFALPVVAKEKVQEDIPLKDLRIFADVFGRIKQQYVEPVSDKVLLEYAIRGMLEGLDPHSSYLDEEHFTELREGTTGEFGGMGLEVGMEDGFVKVIAPIDDTPAQKAGIKTGDLIIRLDDKSLKGLSLNESVKLMRGKPGSEVKLTVSRKGEAQPLIFEIVRDTIKHASVKHRLLAPGYGYVRLSQFQSHTAKDMLKAIAKLKKESSAKLLGLVLDLRNNPGGVLNGAVAVSDAFLTSGLVVYTEGRGKDSLLKFNAAPDDVLDGIPMVVLINGGSASASEIVAGALQDHHRAVIMGQPSFGKGSVQTILPINTKTAIKLTTARYFTPNGRSIQAEGIVPDIELQPVELKKPAHKVKRLKEADLRDHLGNPNKENAPDKGRQKADKKDKKDKKTNLAAEDYALNEALNLLKGMAILSAGKN